MLIVCFIAFAMLVAAWLVLPASAEGSEESLIAYSSTETTVERGTMPIPS